MNHSVYVTTSIPYVNASPHIGHALELVQADAITRYHRLLGRQVVLQTGTDENAHKNVLAAQESGLPVRELVERNAARFRELAVALGVSYDGFVRTAEAPHRRGVEWIWSRLDTADLARRSYEGLYCTGCEDFLTAEGKKIGKSLGNAVDPFAAAERRGWESLRCYLLSLSPFADSDYAEAAHDVLHESRLSNGLGNLASRVSALCETAAVGAVLPPGPAPSGYHENMESYRLDRALDLLWGEVAAINREIDARRPWQDPAGSATRQAVRGWAARLRSLSFCLRPFLPATGERLESLLGGASIRKIGALFPRGGRG